MYRHDTWIAPCVYVLTGHIEVQSGSGRSWSGASRYRFRAGRASLFRFAARKSTTRKFIICPQSQARALAHQNLRHRNLRHRNSSGPWRPAVWDATRTERLLWRLPKFSGTLQSQTAHGQLETPIACEDSHSAKGSVRRAQHRDLSTGILGLGSWCRDL